MEIWDAYDKDKPRFNSTFIEFNYIILTQNDVIGRYDNVIEIAFYGEKLKNYHCGDIAVTNRKALAAVRVAENGQGSC